MKKEEKQFKEKVTKPKIKVGPKIKKPKDKSENESIFGKINKEVVIILAILFILLVIVVTSVIVVNVRYSKYKHYEEKIKTYAFDTLYDNGTCNTSEKVTKAEAIKLALATVFNTTDISWFAEEYDEYPNQTWVEYAKDFGVISDDEITKNNYDRAVKYYEVVQYFESAKKVFSDIEDKGIDHIVLKDAVSYSSDTQRAFSDMVASEIIVVKTNNIDAKKDAIKGQVNELVVNFLEKFSFVTIDGARLRFSDMPENASDYPYILFDVPTEVYEYESQVGLPLTEEMNAKELFTYRKDDYLQIKEFVEGYYEAMLNVDYNNINIIKYSEKLDKYSVFSNLTTSVLEYCEYVKNNHIKMTADVTLMEPCIYFDGASYRARIKIDLNIESTDTRDNLILYDNFYKDTYTYNQNSYTIYADACLTNAVGSDAIFMEPQIVLGDIILNANDLDITFVENVDNSNSEVVE